MDEEIELELTPKQRLIDQAAVTVLCGLAGLLTSTVVEKAYRGAVKAYRIKHTGGFVAK